MKAFASVLGVLVLAIAAVTGVSMNNPFFCYSTDPIRSMTNMHSVGTSYEAIRRFNFTTVNPYVSTCTPSRIWYLGRYGGKYPSIVPGSFPFTTPFQEMDDFAESSIQDDIVSNFNAGRTTLCRQDLEAIRDWRKGENFDIINAGASTEAGVIAMQNIARRFQAVFPDILPSTYSPDRFFFRHHRNQRTNISIRAFATGLFGEAGSQNVIYEDIPEFDLLLRPLELCPQFGQELDWTTERDAFQNGPEITQMVENVNRKLGFHGSNLLSFQIVLLMWEWCRFETAYTFELSNSETGEDSAWCAPFSVADHLLMEYLDDLSFFYFSGYGFRNQRLLENLHCSLYQDLLNHLQSNDDSDPMARIFVAYTHDVQGLLVALGTFRDRWPLHRHNFAQQQGRHWLTSLIGAFGSNLAVVRFDCDDDDDDLIFLLNERPILVPGCDQRTGICKMSFIVNKLQRFIGADCEALFCSND